MDFFKTGYRLREYLTSVFPDIEVYIDQVKSKGKQWDERNTQELLNSNLVIILLTPAALNSPMVKKEVELSKKEKKLILPCKDNKTRLEWNELPYGLKEFDGIKFTDDEDLQRSLFSEIKKIRTEISNQTNSDQKVKNKIFAYVDKKSYSKGDTIMLEGKIETISNNTPVSIIVKSPLENIVSIGQITVNNDGRFTNEIIAGGPLMKHNGEYQILVKYGSANATVYFEYNQVESENHTIRITAKGTSSDENFCIPRNLNIKSNDLVTWENTSSVAHTITSGNPDDGPTGEFDTSLLMSDASYNMKFIKRKHYEYFCMVHPWEMGSITVE